jgi:hypothetical protein
MIMDDELKYILKNIDDKFVGIQKSFEDYKEYHEKLSLPMRNSISNMEKCLNGNGKVGLVAKVDSIEKEIENKKDENKQVKIGIFVAIATGLIALISEKLKGK